MCSAKQFDVQVVISRSRVARRENVLLGLDSSDVEHNGVSLFFGTSECYT
jgi:hypothetical protein